MEYKLSPSLSGGNATLAYVFYNMCMNTTGQYHLYRSLNHTLKETCWQLDTSLPLRFKLNSLKSSYCFPHQVVAWHTLLIVYCSFIILLVYKKATDTHSTHKVFSISWQLSCLGSGKILRHQAPMVGHQVVICHVGATTVLTCHCMGITE